MMVNKTPSPALPRDAATVVVLREAAAGLQVLLLQRAERGDHNSGAWVFPGGLVDAADRVHGEGAFRHAALRECFEECGILLARDAAGAWPAWDDAQRAELAALRPRVAAGQVAIEAVCSRFGVRPAWESLHFIAHWLTPMGRAKRFDTRFFVTVVPAAEQALHDAGETTDHVWMPVAEALSPDHARRLMTPTRATLEALRPFDSAAALQAWAAQPRQVPCILPRLALAAGGLRPVLPGEPAHDEIALLDPHGHCQAWCELRPGVAVALSPRLTRITGEDGRHRYVLDGDEVDGAAPVLVAGDRIVIEGDAGTIPDALLAQADWIAPRRGFVRRVNRTI
jgi:8-oxo-dGTP pyrophosphatase MutT (NUDIX family)